MDYNVDNESLDFDKLIIEIYDAALTRKWGRVLGKCNQVFQANKTFLLLRDVAQNRVVAWRLKAAEEAFFGPLSVEPLTALSCFSPLFNHLQEGDIFDTGSDEFRQRNHALSLVETVFQPFHAERTLAALLLRDERYEAFLGVCRGERDDNFSTFEYVAFKRLVPHFIRASRIFRDEEHFRQQQTLAQGLYDHIKTAFVVCDRKLQVLACNQQAEAYFRSGGAVGLSQHKLTFTSQYQYSKFAGKVSECLAMTGRYEQQIVHVIDDNVEKLEIFHIHKLASQTVDERRESIVVINIIIRRNPNWKSVQSCYALDKRDILIVRMLYKDASYADIANATQMSELAVKDDVQRILRLVNVRSEEALVTKLGMFCAAPSNFY